MKKNRKEKETQNRRNLYERRKKKQIKREESTHIAMWYIP